MRIGIWNKRHDEWVSEIDSDYVIGADGKVYEIGIYTPNCDCCSEYIHRNDVSDIYEARVKYDD